MSEPAFFVEGFLEKEFVKKICKGKTVRRLEINGESVSIGRIVDKIETLARLLNNRYHPIVVLFDRETRKESSAQIVAEVLHELEARSVPGKFVVGVPDRMIENWILADPAILKSLGAPTEILRKKTLDGENGKALLKRYLSGRAYKETLDGVEFLSKAIASSISLKSLSFRSFKKSLPLRCFWLAR